MSNNETSKTDSIVKVFDWCYESAIKGNEKLKLKSVKDLAEEYLSKYQDKKIAAKKMMENQILKCTSSGAITSFGGVATMPITLSANLTSVLYIQMRMIACAAYMGGYELDSDITQTFAYACLAGVSVGEVFKKFGVQFVKKSATATLKKIPGKVFIAINKKIGFRFITKAGTKGLINAGKLIPVLGSVVGGSFDYVQTKMIAERAFKNFIEDDYNPGLNEEVLSLEEINEFLDNNEQ